MTQEQLVNNFSYHPPTPEQIPVYNAIRSRFRELAEFLNETLPESREKSVAFTELETSQFWANASIARNK